MTFYLFTGNKRDNHIVIVKYIKSFLIHLINYLKHTKLRPTDIDTAEENNSYRMLTQQRPVSN